jgi:hypothetical protein
MYHSEPEPAGQACTATSGASKWKPVARASASRRLHKAFLRYHDANNWPLLREVLKQMGRADLIGNGHQQLIPSFQPPGTGTRRPPPASAAAKTAPRAPVRSAVSAVPAGTRSRKR